MKSLGPRLSSSCLYRFLNANVIGYFNPEWENELGVIYVFDYTNPEVQKYIIHVFTDNKKRG